MTQTNDRGLTKQRLLTPGPTEVPPAVLLEMAKPIIHHRTKQFQAIFGMNDKKLEFSRGALEEIAQTAIDRETGVRALRSILEDLLLDVLYELPARKDTVDFMVDEDVVHGRKALARGLTAESMPSEEEVAPEPVEEAEEGPTSEPEEPRESA